MNLEKLKTINFKDPKILFLLVSTILVVIFLFIILIVIVVNNMEGQAPLQESSNGGDHEEEVEVISKDGKIVNLEINFFGLPVLSGANFNLFSKDSNIESPKIVYKTGSVSKGVYTDQQDLNLDLENFVVYRLFFTCSNINILYSSEYPYVFLISESVSDESCSLVDRPGIFSSNVVVQNFHQNIFNISDIVSNKGNYFIQVNDYSRRILYEFIGKENTLVQVDQFDNFKIFSNPSLNYEKFVIYSPEGFPYSYVLWPSIFSWQQSDGARVRTYNVKIKLEGGSEVVKKYILEDIVNCEPSYIETSSTRNFVILGSAIDGSEIYIRNLTRDRNLRFLQDLYSRYLEKDSETPLSYEQFLDDYPVIYWRSPFGNIIRLLNMDYNRECIWNI